jgi:hypothetical protein
MHFFFVKPWYLQEVGCGCMDWIDMARDTDMWWALANAVMNLRGSIQCEKRLAENRLPSQEGLCSMQQVSK